MFRLYSGFHNFGLASSHHGEKSIFLCARPSIFGLHGLYDNRNPNDLPLQESNSDLSRITTEKKKSEKKLRPCYITVENKADYHYEVIESVIMQFPLPWDTFNCSKEDTIADVALAQHHRWAKNELEPWQNYFETHLAGTTRPRTNGDGAVIHFGSIQNYMNYSRAYDAYIGVSCDSFDWLRQLSKGPNQYCVLHGTVDKKIMQGRKKSLWEQHKERVCWVSPMHPCYFIPSDLPQFKPENFRKGDKLRLCLKASTPTTSLRYVDEGVKRLQQSGEPNIEIITMGRLMPIMSEAFPSISHLVMLNVCGRHFEIVNATAQLLYLCIVSHLKDSRGNLDA